MSGNGSSLGGGMNCRYNGSIICQYSGGGLFGQLIWVLLRRLPPLIRLLLFGCGEQASAQFLLRRSAFMYRTSLVFEVSKEASDFWCATVHRLE